MSSNERTPLIQIIQISQPRRRYSHGTTRRLCTAILGVSLLVVVTLFLLPGPLSPLRSGPTWLHNHSGRLPYHDLQQILLSTPSEHKAKEWSTYYTSGPHLAGKNLSQAIWTKERWQEFGISNTIINSYDVYVNYPIGHRLALLERNANTTEVEHAEGEADGEASSSARDWEVIYEASLEEDVLKEDSTSSLPNRIPTFHGYSASGNVIAPYVFVNYGTYQDFEDLRNANISLLGKIALVKYGRVFRGLKVKRAQELGMVGAIIYSDPGDDGKITDENGIATYPDGPAREPSSVQRGSVQFMSKPTTCSMAF